MRVAVNQIELFVLICIYFISVTACTPEVKSENPGDPGNGTAYAPATAESNTGGTNGDNATVTTSPISPTSPPAPTPGDGGLPDAIITPVSSAGQSGAGSGPVPPITTDPTDDPNQTTDSDTQTTGQQVDPPPLPDGDPDGNPGGAVVSIPETACGPAPGLDVWVAGTGIPGPGTPNVQIGGRDVVLSYPCNKREGAHVTFILNLHGTMPDEALKLYQHGYFSAHTLVDSHSLIVATPKSVVSQWANGDGGVDIPHLYEVVDWVYSKFSQFKITGMWVGGHSWGSMFAKSFVCDEAFRDKARGVIGMSGGPTGVGGLLGGGDCADRLSQIHTVGDQEGGEAGVPDQTAAATKHGCDARLPPRDIGNGQMLYEWPNCDPGWVHFNFVMGNHNHITSIDPPVVLHIVEAIKSTEI